MKEKRISLRFRTDNEKEMKAWNLLEERVKTSNISKNSLVINYILSGLEQGNYGDEFAEQIAELVAKKMKGKTIQREAKMMQDMDNDVSESMDASKTDEPVVLGEEAIDFLDIFG